MRLNAENREKRKTWAKDGDGRESERKWNGLSTHRRTRHAGATWPVAGASRQHGNLAESADPLAQRMP
ncbi:hypothetical protein ON010_g17093 [Phytophthora cinnamomi]|nr:hypothetical protein ON010_g17093 [Phytophthora cinnamomi]